MRIVMRMALSIAIVTGAGFAIQKWCVRPLICSVVEKRLEQSTMRVAQYADPDRLLPQARLNLQASFNCLDDDPTNVNLYMIAAANARILHQPERAIELYEHALRYDHRRELYANLGNAYSEAGNRTAAIESLTRANVFWADSINDIEDPFVHDEVERRYNRYAAEIESRIRR